MSEHENVQLVNKFLQDHDVASLAPDAVYHDFTLPEPLRGREAISRQLDMLYKTAFPGARDEIRQITAGEDRVVAEVNFVGVNSGNLMGIPATNRSVELPICEVFSVDGDQIREIRVYYDASSLTRQLGVASATPK